MFGNNKKKENTRNTKGTTPTPASSGLNSLVQGTTITGDIQSESDIRVDGTIKGTLQCNAKVILGPTGYIEGTVNCKNAIIEGRFEGTLHVEDLLNVKETAEINGDIFTQKLIVQSGAIFNVGCRMGNQQELKAQAKQSTTAKKVAKEVATKNGEKQEETKKAS